MKDVNFDSGNTRLGKIRVHGIVQVISLIRMNKSYGTFHYFNHSKILHGPIKARGEFARCYFGIQVCGSWPHTTPRATKGMPHIDIIQTFEFSPQVPYESLNPTTLICFATTPST